MDEIENITDAGRWVMTCDCGNTIRQKDLAYIGSTEPCESCVAVLAHTDDWFERPSVARELGWCGCGDNERVDELMLRYLDSVPSWERPASDLSADEHLLLAYVADSAGWTEHGGSVGGAWLTPSGELVRSRLREMVGSV